MCYNSEKQTREARDMELQWYDIRQLDDGEAHRVTAMMDETRRRRVADIAW